MNMRRGLTDIEIITVGAALMELREKYIRHRDDALRIESYAAQRELELRAGLESEYWTKRIGELMEVHAHVQQLPRVRYHRKGLK